VSRLAYVTPAQEPVAFECRALLLPVGQSWQAIFTGMLYELTLENTFEQVEGLTAAQTAAIFAQSFNAFIFGEGCPMFEGMIVLAGGSTPPAGWLVCDGAAYNQADYPGLYTAIGDTFGNDGAGTFRVPDLRGRSPLGAGQGASLTNRVLAASGGSETHQLTTSEIPAHYHNIDVVGSSGSTTGILYTAFGAGADFGNIAPSTGGGLTHNNMHPWLALSFFIYSGR